MKRGSESACMWAPTIKRRPNPHGLMEKPIKLSLIHILHCSISSAFYASIYSYMIFPPSLLFIQFMNCFAWRHFYNVICCDSRHMGMINARTEYLHFTNGCHGSRICLMRCSVIINWHFCRASTMCFCFGLVEFFFFYFFKRRIRI